MDSWRTKYIVNMELSNNITLMNYWNLIAGHPETPSDRILHAQNKVTILAKQKKLLQEELKIALN